MNDIRESVRAFISKNFYLPDASVLGDDTSFLAAGIVDSTGVLEVVGFLETTFAIQVEDEDLVPQNLDSVAALVSFVQRKRAA
jgi:acyl carrier protein